jgi:hypothetical protein
MKARTRRPAGSSALWCWRAIRYDSAQLLLDGTFEQLDLVAVVPEEVRAFGRVAGGLVPQPGGGTLADEGSAATFASRISPPRMWRATAAQGTCAGICWPQAALLAAFMARSGYRAPAHRLVLSPACPCFSHTQRRLPQEA